MLKASLATGDRVDFAAGQGNDADARALVWLMDTTAFPLVRAENYHQFHDGFAWGENYPDSYDGLRESQSRAGDFKGTACPNGMLGIGVAGL